MGDDAPLPARLAVAGLATVSGTLGGRLVFHEPWTLAVGLGALLGVFYVAPTVSRWGRLGQAAAAGLFAGLAGWLVVGLGLAALPFGLVAACLPAVARALEARHAGGAA